MPNKTVVGQYLDELSPAAKMAGAVNTIVNDNGKLIGWYRIHAVIKRQ